MMIHETFGRGAGGFQHADDVFEFTSQPSYSAGAYRWTGGYAGSGGLTMTLGGRDNASVSGMSGGWGKSFTLDSAQDVTLTFRYRMNQSRDYERDEYSEVRVAIDGREVGTGGRDYVARLTGDGNGGSTKTTGWKTVTLELGHLDSGKHTIQLGGFNNGKTAWNERTDIAFDDVKVEGTGGGGRPGSGTDTDGPESGGTGGGGTGGSAPVSLEAFEARVLELTNQFRVANGKDPLSSNSKLNSAAEDWSKSMADGDFFRHSTTDQVKKFGYDYRSWGENIAAGQRTPEDVVDAWKSSSGHRANMLRDGYEDIGIGHTYLPDDSGQVNYRHYWVQVFGTEADNLV